MTGRAPLRRLSALEQLQVQKEYPGLLPGLLRLGLKPEDALAVAFNTTLLSRALERGRDAGAAPRELLARLSLGEIAALCEEYRRVELGEVEYGGTYGEGGE